MVINVKQELIKVLAATYGVPVRAEETRQSFEPPCFFVQTVNTRQRDELHDRHRRLYSFDVQYFPAKPEASRMDETNAELEAMGAELAMQLVFLPEAKLRGSSISYRVVDKVLHFLVDYTIGLTQLKEQPKMLKLHEEVKPYERDRNNENSGR